ncbi:MAG TPA: DUF305 domain-containing protein [Natronosporangium sp.]
MSATLTETPPETAEGSLPPPRRGFGVGILALGVVVGLLAGFAVAMFALRPDPPPGDDSPEAGFARDMITHHDQAVTMGMIAYVRATDPAVRQLGYDIAMTQQGQIGMMHQWLLDWGLDPTGSQPRMAWMADELDQAMIQQAGLMPGMATEEEMARLREEAEGVEVDLLFLDLMTTHHLGGLHMVDAVLERSDHPQVTALAEIMRAGQEKELQELTALKDRLGG